MALSDRAARSGSSRVAAALRPLRGSPRSSRRTRAALAWLLAVGGGRRAAARRRRGLRRPERRDGRGAGVPRRARAAADRVDHEADDRARHAGARRARRGRDRVEAGRRGRRVVDRPAPGRAAHRRATCSEAALIQSANDAANALAAHVGGGTVPRFVELMNARARQLGLARHALRQPRRARRRRSRLERARRDEARARRDAEAVHPRDGALVEAASPDAASSTGTTSSRAFPRPARGQDGPHGRCGLVAGGGGARAAE